LKNGIHILAAVADTVEFVHRRGIAHRNLHASNILIATDGRPKLIGFGRVGLLAGSDPHAVFPGTRASIDVQGFQKLIEWLFSTQGGSPPDHLMLVESSAENFARSLRKWLAESR